MASIGSGISGRRVCVIGSGISGLSAAWLLHRNGASVTLMEKEEHCGGHTLTDHTSPYAVDLGFQVYNLTTYPHFVGFLECLGVDSVMSDMSFSLSMDDGKLEWGSDNLDSVFAQRKNIASPTFLAMLKDVLRFGREAPKVLDPAVAHIYDDMTLGQYLVKHGYSAGFRDNYVVPMCAAVWSVPNAQVLQFPVRMLVRFWVNHHLLDILQRPLWRVVKGRSEVYVKRVCDELPDVRTNTPVLRVTRGRSPEEGVTVETAAAGPERFDAVVFATHSDITLQLLGQDVDPVERDVLAAIPYNENDVYLHTDPSLMPRNRKVWASWNFLGSSAPGSDTAAVCVTYWANRLQAQPPGAPNLFVTLNAPRPPAAEHVIRRLSMAHPVFSGASVAAQAQLPSLQGHRNTYYAGAWAGYGFHEDGIRSAVAVVEAMGGTLPWVPRATNPKVSFSQRLLLGAFDKYARVAFKQGYMRLILPTGYELVYGSQEAAKAPVMPGEEWRGRPAPRCTLRVLDMDFFRKIVTRHDVGLGEAYMAGDFEADSLDGFMAVLTVNAVEAERERGHLGLFNWLGERLLFLAHTRRPNTINGSRKNIEEHYDAGNAMYKLFLDATLTYSSGLYRSPTDSLYQSQLNKIDALVAKAKLTAADNVLEIGCGWGGFAIRAVHTTGCRWTGITISKEQLSEATERVAAAGLQDRITLLFCDYRDTPATLGAGSFDAVVSVEMIEAVGHAHLRPYFGVIGTMLKPGGRAVLQAICCADERYEAYCNTSDFIREHIFPGGHLPSLGAVADCCRGIGLALRDTRDIGPDYAVTLRSWRAAWERRRGEVLALGYSDRFWRKYRFYFVFCEAAFDARYIHNYHLLLVKETGQGQGWGQGQPQQGVSAAAAATITTTATTGAAWAPAPGTLARGLAHELPSDPVTQVLMALYFFLTGLLVARQPLMWLLPAASCLMAAVTLAAHLGSLALVPSYRFLTPERRALWCGDIAHILYACVASTAALLYSAYEPRALQLAHPPSNITIPAIITAASTGVFAFNLWMCLRTRLFQRSVSALLQYTVLLVLFGTATYKGVAVPLLAAMLASEVFSVVFLMGKLQEMAGMGGTSLRRYTRLAEQATLVMCRLVPHAAVTVAVLTNPAAFGSVFYYVMCLVGMAFTNWLNLHKAVLLFGRPAVAAAQGGDGQGGRVDGKVRTE